jgi:hypothetical protein
MYSIFESHVRSMSIGHVMVALDPSGRATTRYLEPGVRMLTGCQIPEPVAMQEHWDHTRRTLRTESWRANVLRYDHTFGPELRPMLHDAIRSVRNESPWHVRGRNFAEVALTRHFMRRTSAQTLSRRAMCTDAERVAEDESSGTRDADRSDDG